MMRLISFYWFCLSMVVWRDRDGCSYVVDAFAGLAGPVSPPNQLETWSSSTPLPAAGRLWYSAVVMRSSTVSSDTTISDIEQDEDTEVEFASNGLLRRDRYVATNRFAVRPGRAGKFEQRWANRKSRVATLPGFRYFHLMRRVKVVNRNDGTTVTEYDEGDTEDAAQENYVSFTVWDKKSDFSAWRKGDAFKEAHGGTSIGAFLSTMVNSAMVLRGPPRPAFYDGLLVQSKLPAQVPETVDGWRQVSANGIDTLPAECWVELTKYYVPSSQAQTFEAYWKSQPMVDVENSPIVASALMRRDGQAKGHGMGIMTDSEPTYVRVVVFPDRASAETSRSSTGVTPPSKLWNPDPETVYYEGTLVISSYQGA